jgi:2-methylcitrate dehydratase PrpD
MTQTTATKQLLDMALDWSTLPSDVRHAVKRHFLDTFGVILAGLSLDVSRKTARVAGLAEGILPVVDDANMASAAFLMGTSAHGIKLDDGYLGGSVHPGVAVVPAMLAQKEFSGSQILTAMFVGYETSCAIAASANPQFSTRGFHPTSTVVLLAAAMGVGRLQGLALAEMSATLHAEAGISAPEYILDHPSDFAQTFAGMTPPDGLALKLPPTDNFNILNCYVKPYACCRYLHPAMDALIGLRERHKLTPKTVDLIEVETYTIAWHHADTGWQDLASAQLNFPYCLATTLEHGTANLSEFEEPARNSSQVAAIAPKIKITATPDMDALYPATRPSLVTVTHSDFSPDASGSRDLPPDDAALSAKFVALVTPSLGAQKARTLYDMLWSLDYIPNAAILLREVAT